MQTRTVRRGRALLPDEEQRGRSACMNRQDVGLILLVLAWFTGDGGAEEEGVL